MASRAPKVHPESELVADTLSDFVLVRTDQIDRGERLREVDEAWAEGLARVLLREQQRTPIEVCRLPGSTRWTLVTGAHRHRAAEIAGIVHLKAEIVSSGRDDRKMREVSENLWRRDLDPIDRAAFVAEAVAIHKRRAGIVANAARERHVPNLEIVSRSALNAEADDLLETISSTYGWSDEVGEQLGFTGRTIRNDLFLYRRLAPSLVARLRDARHPAARNASQLRALAKLDLSAQSDVVDVLLGGNGWEPVKTVAEAIRRSQPASAPVRDDNKLLSRFLTTFSKMTLAERKGALAHLRDLLPAGVTLSGIGGDE